MATYRYPSTLSGNDPRITFINQTSGGEIALYYPVGFQIQDGAQYGNIDTGIVGALYSQSQSSGTSMSDALKDANAKFKGMGKENGATGQFGVLAFVNKMGFGTGTTEKLEGAASAAAGISINPNTVLQYQNSDIRNYTFQFRLIPESEAEAKEIKDIVKAFRLSMYATKTEDFLLKYPDKWIAHFKNSDGIPKKTFPLYLTSLNTTYNPQGNLMLQGNVPNETVIDLSFRETQPLTRTEVEELES
jgi:hypothetical protein